MGRHTRWTCDDCGYESSAIKPHAAREEHYFWHRTDEVGKTKYLSLKGAVIADGSSKSGFRSIANAIIGDEPRPEGKRKPYRHYNKPAGDRVIIPRPAAPSITPYEESPDFDESGHPLGVTEDDLHRASLRKRMRQLRGDLYAAGLCVECAGDHSHYTYCSQFAPVPDATVEVEQEHEVAV